MKFRNELRKMYACNAAQEWVGERDLATAWHECQRADWMLWYMARRKVDQRLLVLCACACAETVLKYIPANEKRPKQAIMAARRGARGKAAEAEVQVAFTRASAAAAAFADVGADAPAYAAGAAADAAYTAVTTGPTRGAAVDAAVNAADAADAAAYDAAADNAINVAAAAWREAMAKMANIVRRVVREWEAAKEEKP